MFLLTWQVYELPGSPRLCLTSTGIISIYYHTWFHVSLGTERRYSHLCGKQLVPELSPQSSSRNSASLYKQGKNVLSCTLLLKDTGECLLRASVMPDTTLGLSSSPCKVILNLASVCGPIISDVASKATPGNSTIMGISTFPFTNGQLLALDPHMDGAFVFLS